MRILIAPDKFKGSLTGQEVGEAISKGIKEILPEAEIRILPLADGGDGSIDILNAQLNLQKIKTDVCDPLGRSLTSYFYFKEDVAYIEMASASGLVLLKTGEPDPLITSTFGTGQMIEKALSLGAKTIYLFLGGSATNDLGMGMAYALGYRFLDKDGSYLKPEGGVMAHVTKIDRSEVLSILGKTKFYGICDVRNPLLGAKGAAAVYGPQKGADAKAIDLLEYGAKTFSKVVAKTVGKDFSENEGSGAAGGLGYGILSFVGGRLISGSSFIMEVLGFDDALDGVDLLITGEGSIDSQTLEGKVIAEVLSRCKKKNIPSWIISGSASIVKEQLESFDIARIDQVIDLASDLDDAMSNAAHYLQEIARTNLTSVLRRP